MDSATKMNVKAVQDVMQKMHNKMNEYEKTLVKLQASVASQNKELTILKQQLIMIKLKDVGSGPTQK